MGLFSGKDKDQRGKAPKPPRPQPQPVPPAYGDWGKPQTMTEVAAASRAARPQPRLSAAPIKKHPPADPRIVAALELAFQHAEHCTTPQQLQWLMDQMVRKLFERPQDYEVWVMMYNRRPAYADWPEGRKP